MKRKFFVVLSLVLVASMLLGACAQTPPAVEPTPGVADAVDTPAAPQATEAPSVAEPTAEPPAPTSDRKGGLLDRIIFSAIEEVEAAVPQLEAGSIDLYAVAAEDAVTFEKVQNTAGLKYAQSYGSNNQMLLNTSVCTDTTKLNPFTSAKIREAMNWAVDRNYIAQEIMGGLAKPKYTVLTGAFVDYARYADIISGLETKYAYDLERAQAVVDEEMPKLGAEKDANGKWTYNGEPVTLIGVHRTEDKRKEIGNYFAGQLEALGFTVDRQDKDRREAAPIWQGEPKDCQFHYYTAGWINTQVSRDDGNNFLQYNTGEIQLIPVMNDYKPSEELYDVSRKLINNEFSSMEERREMFKTALELSMEESLWGIWVTDNISFSPYVNTVVGAYDLAGGFASAQLWPYTLQREGQEGGEVKIAQSGILVNPWNPVAGSNFTDDSMIQRGTMDWGVIYAPYTGRSRPKLINQLDVVATRGLPIQNSSDWVNLTFEDRITVPEDAWVDWDAAEQKFITAGEKFPEGLTSKVKATMYYVPEIYQTKWHDGSNFSLADMVMNIILNFDTAKPESKIYDESVASTLDTFLSQFRGTRIVSTDPLVIEVYTDGYSLDAENTVFGNFNLTWYPSYTYGPGAWHNLVPGILAEENNELAFSTDKALANEVEWTSLIAGPSLDIQAKYLEQAAADGYIPYANTLGQYITADEAAARYANLQKWYAEKKHLFIGTGPYYVDQVFPVEGTITLVRNEEYLFPASQWSVYAEPKLVTATIEGPTSVAAGEEAAFDVYISFKDEAYPSADLDQVTYNLYNEQNEVVASGAAEMVAEGLYQVIVPADVTGKLEAGGSKLTVAVSSKVVSLPAFTTYEFVITK